jgi:hypothetical protein
MNAPIRPQLAGAHHGMLLLRCCTLQLLAPDVWLNRGTCPAEAAAVAPQ